MKRIINLSLVCILAITLMIGCTSTPEVIENTLKEDVTLESLYNAVDVKFKETYGEDFGVVMMPMAIDPLYLTDFCAIEESKVEEVFGNTSGSMTNSDTFFGIKTSEGEVENVKVALEKRLEDIKAQYEMYPVSGSYDRALSGEVYQKGDYLFLIVVGILDMDADTEIVDFTSDVTMTKEVIDSMFN